MNLMMWTEGKELSCRTKLQVFVAMIIFIQKFSIQNCFSRRELTLFCSFNWKPFLAECRLVVNNLTLVMVMAANNYYHDKPGSL